MVQFLFIFCSKSQTSSLVLYKSNVLLIAKQFKTVFAFLCWFLLNHLWNSKTQGLYFATIPCILTKRWFCLLRFQFGHQELIVHIFLLMLHHFVVWFLPMLWFDAHKRIGGYLHEPPQPHISNFSIPKLYIFRF